jgi:hypothetical protein
MLRERKEIGKLLEETDADSWEVVMVLKRANTPLVIIPRPPRRAPFQKKETQVRLPGEFY